MQLGKLCFSLILEHSRLLKGLLGELGLTHGKGLLTLVQKTKTRIVNRLAKTIELAKLGNVPFEAFHTNKKHTFSSVLTS